jgi:hypothetical protein
MRSRSASLLALLLVCLVLSSGCAVYYGVGKATGLIRPPAFVLRGPIPENFHLTVEVHDAAQPPVDFLLEFDRSGRASYDVVVRAPRRLRESREFELTEDQIVSLWKAVGAARFDELADRYPTSGDGPDRASGVATLYVRADQAERRVESHFQANPSFDGVRKAALAVLPAGALSASGAAGGPRDAPKEYVAETTTHLFHRPECPRLKDVPPANTTRFASIWDAYNFHFRPCPDCKPDQTR